MLFRFLLPAVLVAASAFATPFHPHLDKRSHRYTKHEKLGSGGFGAVYRATDENGRDVALKCLLRKGEDADMRKEFKFQNKVHDSHVLSAYEIADVDGETCMAIELAPGGSLQDRLTKGVRNTEEEAKALAKSLLQGLVAIHRAGLAHRDIKPGNTLITSDGSVKISDFGLSCFSDDRSTAQERNKRGGTSVYKAPEMQSSTAISDPRPLDVYAMGISIWQLLVGANARDFDRKKIRVDGLAKDLIFKMTDPDPARRITSEQALNHSWFVGLTSVEMPAKLPTPRPARVEQVPGVKRPTKIEAPASEHHHHHFHLLDRIFHHHHDGGASARH